MFRFLKQFWNYISHIGLSVNTDLSYPNLQKEIFFNRALVIGFFGVLSSTYSLIPFIGSYAYLNLLMNFFIIAGLVLHAHQKFNIAKRIVFYGIMMVGYIVTFYIGPDTLFHINSISVCIFGIIVFDSKKEKFDIFLCVLVTFVCLVSGELIGFYKVSLLDHPDYQEARFMAIMNITVIISVFVAFVIRKNNISESKVLKLVRQNENLIEEINVKTDVLLANNIELEKLVISRTKEINAHNQILAEQNNEKEMLLKEVHHRVKNNLQIIISLINLEITKFKTQHVENAMIETQNRVMSMSLVHKKMYQTSNFIEIFLSDYCLQLLDNVKRFSDRKSFTSSLKIDDKVFLGVDKAIPFGLILNEMVMNFFKHAVPQKDDLHLSIILTHDDGIIKFYFVDNGQGFPSEILKGETDSLGLELIEILTDQLDGEFEIRNEHGALYELNFRV